MLFQIRHELHYRYGRAVFLEPHTLRLTPRQDSTQRLVQHSVELLGAPAGGSASVLEPGGGDATVFWFTALRQTLDFTSTAVVETLRANPFNWIITDPQAQRLPVSYEPAMAEALAPYLGSAEEHPSVQQWAESLAQEVGHSTTDFLTHLAARIHHTFHHQARMDGDPMTAAETLELRQGACRDTAMLYVEACRSLGLAARFVSGYSMHHPPEVSEHELHAWAEVWLPGGGWRSFDPSLGLAVADGHVALSAARDHRLAAAVSGHYRGTGVSSTFSYSVDVQARTDQSSSGRTGIE